MTPHFAQAVNTVILRVIEILRQPGQLAQHRGNVMPIQRELEQWLAYAERQLGAQTESWQLAKYALVCWIDEMFIHRLDWREWENFPLEEQIYRQRLGRRRFFAAESSSERQFGARRAAELEDFDPLEVYYLCVVLGFRGFYQDPIAAAEEANSFYPPLPPTLDQWLASTTQHLRVGPGPPPAMAPGSNFPTGAPPRLGRLQFLGALVPLFALVGINVVLLLHLGWHWLLS